MIPRKFRSLALVSSLFIFSGCALFLVGAGVGGGIAISKDTIEGDFTKSQDQVWRASREVLMKEGFIRLEDKARGVINAEVRNSDVKVEIRSTSEKNVRIHIKARKGHKLLPNIGLANELYNKIFAKLR